MTLVLVLLGLLLGSVIFWWAGRWMRRRLMFPSGGFSPVSGLQQQLVSYKYGVTGKPDLIIEREGFAVPVLVKTGRVDKSPYESHLAQIMVHCLLIEEETQQAPPYGIIRYDNRTFEIDYDDEMFNSVVDLLDEMHTSREQFDREAGPERSHDIRQRCYACRYCKRCEESLVNQ